MEKREKLSKKRIFGMFFLLGCLFAASVGGMLWFDQEEASKAVQELTISLDSGFYDRRQELTVTAPAGARVYYTADCEIPDETAGTLYEKPIVLEAGEEEQVYVYRFLAVYADGRKSPVETRTYFVGKNIKDRYDMMVLHLTGDPEGLFGYETGIFVPGKVWDEFCEANPSEPIGNMMYGNFTERGPEWEREVYIQFFSENGTLLTEQNGGVRIHGGMTRLKNQKSFRLYARKEYDEKNEFKYAFFGDLNSEEDGTLGEEYKRLIVRNSGNDNGYGFIRNDLVAILASDAGFPDVMHSVPVAVYINGGYYGVYWLNSNYDGQYFENRYGKYDGEFVVIGGIEREKEPEEDPHIQEYVEAYNSTYEELSALDLTDEENYEKVCRFMDVENYLQYFAIEQYVGNMDWPNNNLKVYRYVDPNGDYKEGTVFDGRYRFLLFDADYGFGLLTFNDTVGIWAQKPTLYKITSEKDTPMFLALMEREDCRAYFINYLCDLMNGPMAKEHVSEVVDELHASRYGELYHMLEETDIMKNSLWEADELLHMDTVEKNIEIIKSFATARPETEIEDLQDTFECGETYQLTIEKGDAFSGIRLNTLYLEDASFTGTYFQAFSITAEPVMAENEVFDGWEVNGEKREERILSLDGEDVQNGEIRVRMITHDVEDPMLEISAVKAKASSDYVEIINRSGQPVSTRGYFLSDSEELKKYAFPVLTLKPGETVRIYGKDVSDPEGLGQLGMNFNLKTGETVTLSRQEEIVDQVLIPDLASEKGVYTRDFNRGKYREEF